VVDRRRFSVDTAGLVRALVDLGSGDSGKEHLRTYWYDGARDLVPTSQQLEIAKVPRVKLRLGRLTGQGQKGVDSRIVRDLIMLAIERAVSDIYLVGGDEDLREGVCEAQERGVRVVLVAVEPVGRSNLSPALAMDADDVIVLGDDFLGPFFLRDSDGVGHMESVPVQANDPESLARAFLDEYLSREGIEAAACLLDGVGGVVPPRLDRELLCYASRALQVARLGHEFKAALRAGFWSAVRESESR